MMNNFNQDILLTIKKFINEDNLIHLQEYYNDLQTCDQQISWDFIYQKAYLHACLMHRKNIVEWMTQLFDNFDPIAKIAMRQMFAYGRHLQERENPYLKNENKN